MNTIEYKEDTLFSNDMLNSLNQKVDCLTTDKSMVQLIRSFVQKCPHSKLKTKCQIKDTEKKVQEVYIFESINHILTITLNHQKLMSGSARSIKISSSKPIGFVNTYYHYLFNTNVLNGNKLTVFINTLVAALRGNYLIDGYVDSDEAMLNVEHYQNNLSFDLLVYKK